MAEEMFVNELISVMRSAAGQWQVRERKTPSARPKLHYFPSMDKAFTHALDLCAGQCSELSELIQLLKTLEKPTHGLIKSTTVAASSNGDQGKRIGMSKSTSHADDLVEGWSEMALGYFRSCPYEKFTVEVIRVYAYQNGLPRPPDCRAWGSIAARAVRLKYIEPIGFKTALTTRAHNRPVREYKKLIQRSNAA